MKATVINRTFLTGLTAVFTLVGCTSGLEAAESTVEIPATAKPTTAVMAAEASDLQASFTFEFDRELTGPTSCPVVGTIFTDTSEGSPSVWMWEFPDGSTSDEASPKVDENVSGLVRLTVSDGTSTRTAEQDVRNNLTC